MTNATTFSPPPHIVATGLCGKPVDFDWEEDDTLQYYDRTSKQLSVRVLPLSPRAQLALAAGIAEWVIWRLHGLADLDDVRQFIEAVWAGVADYRYVIEWTRPQDRELSGPVLQPQWIAARLLDDVLLTGMRRVPTHEETMNLAFLAQHVVRGNRAYKSWLKEVTERLAKISPMSDYTRVYFKTLRHTQEERRAFDWGAPVPRAAMDTTTEYHESQAAQLIDAYLRQLDPSPNRFLNTREQLRAAGFEGEPYTFSTP